jgi:hypothetical protein
MVNIRNGLSKTGRYLTTPSPRSSRPRARVKLYITLVIYCSEPQTAPPAAPAMDGAS